MAKVRRRKTGRKRGRKRKVAASRVTKPEIRKHRRRKATKKSAAAAKKQKRRRKRGTADDNFRQIRGTAGRRGRRRSALDKLITRGRTFADPNSVSITALGGAPFLGSHSHFS